MRFPYKKYPRPGGRYAYHAILGVHIGLPEPRSPRSKKIEAWVDSGASRTTFHASLGRAMGFQIEQGEPEDAIGISGKPSRTWLHDIALHVPGGVIHIRAAFSDQLPVAGILGMEGFFDHFTVTFDCAAKCLVLERVHQA